jgi:hypothetical protein
MKSTPRGTPHIFPHAPETKQKIGEKNRAYFGLPLEERRARQAERALKRMRWLTNCIVIRTGQQIFDVTVPGDDGAPTRIRIMLPENAPPLDFLLAVMRCPAAPLIMRMEAAKYAAVFMHERKMAHVAP